MIPILFLMLWSPLLSSASYICHGVCTCSNELQGPSVTCPATIDEFTADQNISSANNIFQWKALLVNRNVRISCKYGASSNDFNWSEGPIFADYFDIDSLILNFCPIPNGPLISAFLMETRNITSLTLGNSRIELDHRHLKGMKLKQLELSNCSLTQLPQDVFIEQGSTLVLLDLRSNKLTEIPQIFEPLENLQRLELGENNLTLVQPGVFSNLSSLKLLNFWANSHLKLLEGSLRGLKSVTSLDFQACGLSDLPQSILEDVPQLEDLSLSANRFRKLPKGLCEHTLKLKIFKLIYNTVTFEEIPNGLLANLTNLKDVIMFDSKLKMLPEDFIWGSFNLTTLELQQNSIENLPQLLLRDAMKLKILNLGHNKLETIPDNFFRACHSLQEVILSFNEITQINEFFYTGLTNLQNLFMDNNHLSSIHSRTFPYNNELQLLELSFNKLKFSTCSTASPLHNLVSLNYLHIRHNKLNEICADWTNTFLKLKELDLSHNTISWLDDSDLRFLSNNTNINLGYNNISYIQLDLSEIISKGNNRNTIHINQIQLEGNPIDCDCKVYQLLRYNEHKMIYNVYQDFQLETSNIVCNSPTALRGTPITQVTSESIFCQAPICPDRCDCSLRRHDFMLSINCSHKGLNEIPKIKSQRKLNHTELDLSWNSIVKTQDLKISGYQNITKLRLSHNNISAIDFLSLPNTVKVLDLDNNNLSFFNTTTIEILADNLHLIYLQNNPWLCNCNAKPFLQFLQNNYSKVANISQITCADGRQLLELSNNDLCPVSQAPIIAGGITIASLGIVIGLLAAVYYRYQNEIKVWLYAHNLCLWLVTEEELDKDKVYDAFISYSHKDEDFVVDKLVTGLETGPVRFKLCLHYRDWIAGDWIPNQIVRSVENSRRTVVVLSPNFVESVWGRMEFRAAHSQALSEGRARVIVVLYGEIGAVEELDPELRAYLSMNTYVKWGDPWFWDKLRYALPHPSKLRNVFEADKMQLFQSSNSTPLTSSPIDSTINPFDIMGKGYDNSLVKVKPS